MAYRKISTMEAQKIAAEEANFGRAIDTVMNAKLKGVHALLVKLGKVDKKYSTALEIAIGGRMTHVVVDDEHVGSVPRGLKVVNIMHDEDLCPARILIPKADYFCNSNKQTRWKKHLALASINT